MIKFKLIDESILDSNGHTDFNNEDYCLKLNFKNYDEFDEFTYDDPDFELFLMDKMESEYGVHDFCGDGDDYVGYSSYEIQDFNEAINKWREFWKSKGKLIS
jgi:hypothetical protein